MLSEQSRRIYQRDTIVLYHKEGVASKTSRPLRITCMTLGECSFITFDSFSFSYFIKDHPSHFLFLLKIKTRNDPTKQGLNVSYPFLYHIFTYVNMKFFSSLPVKHTPYTIIMTHGTIVWLLFFYHKKNCMVIFPF